MKKDEAIEYLVKKGFTRRAAGKIYRAAVENVEIDASALETAIKTYMNKED